MVRDDLYVSATKKGRVLRVIKRIENNFKNSTKTIILLRRLQEQQ